MAEEKYKLIDYNVLADEVIGHANISSISDGTLRGAVKKINTDLGGVKEHLTELSYGDLSGGKNIIDIQNPLSLTGTWYQTVYFDCEKNTDYTISFTIDSYTVNRGMSVYDLGGTKIGGQYYDTATFNSGNNTRLALYIYSGTATSGTTVYSNIQIEKGTTATDYEPYIASNKILTEELQNVNSSLGTVTNMLKSTLQSSVVDTVTCTKNNDGTYTLNTSNPTTTASGFTLGNIDVKKGKAYKIVGCPKGGGESKYRLWTISSTAFPINHRLQDTGDGTVMTALADETVTVTINFGANQSFSNFVFKPMICTNQNAQYSDYVPYTGSTGKLNSDVAELNNNLDKLVIRKYIGNLSVTVAANNVKRVEPTIPQKDGYSVVACFVIDVNNLSAIPIINSRSDGKFVFKNLTSSEITTNYSIIVIYVKSNYYTTE